MPGFYLTCSFCLKRHNYTKFKTWWQTYDEDGIKVLEMVKQCKKCLKLDKEIFGGVNNGR